jgi:hypothetical protein
MLTKTQRVGIGENEAVPEVRRCISVPLVKFASSINPGFVFLARVYDLFAA